MFQTDLKTIGAALTAGMGKGTTFLGSTEFAQLPTDLASRATDLPPGSSLALM